MLKSKVAVLRGQSAIEYVMSYSWAILVVMVVGIALWQLGILNLASQGITSKGFSKIQPQLSATGLSNNSVFTGVFVNGAGTRIFLTGVRIYNGDSLICCSHEGAGSGCTDDGSDIHGKTAMDLGNEGGVFIPAGEVFKVEVGGETKRCTVSNSVGERYEIKIDIDYSTFLDRQTIEHTSSGTISGPLE
ncbi:MAG: hypothetical protein KKD39_03135 [Candidatus Altiarchaeota archaeon]|nr:hypothetical protein [Candidatus Altiarchaeota archaeon]